MAYASPARLQAHVEVDSEPMPRAALAPAHPVSTEWQLSIYEDFAAVEAEWRAFEQYADCTVFQSFGWLSTWARQVGARRGTQPLIVIGRDAAGGMRFLLPLAIEVRGIARRLTWFGSDLCDYNAPLLAPDFTSRGGGAQFMAAWRDIVERLHSHPRWNYDLIDFEKMLETVGAQPNPMLQLGVSVHSSRAYQTRLAGDWDAYYNAKRSSSTRRRDRTKRNRLADFGEVQFVTAVEADEVRDSLATLMAQKSRSFADMGVANIFARPGYPEFYRTFATAPETRQFAHVSRLDIGSSAAAVNFGLIFRDCYYHILASHTESEAGRFGPRFAHLHDLLRYAIARGCHTFDFTIGDERYKRDWCEIEIALYDHVAVASLRGAVAALPIVATRRLKDWIKRNPALLDFVMKARSRLGAWRLGRRDP